MYKKMLLSFLVVGSTLNAAKLDLSSGVFSPDESIVVRFSEMTAQNKDWIGIYPTNSSNDWSNVLLWKWTNDRSSDTLTFGHLPVGSYEVRAFYNNSFTTEVSKKFSVKDSATSQAVVTSNKNTYGVGENVVVEFSNMSGSNQDWVAIYPKGSSNDWSNVLQWSWIDGEVEGTHLFNSLPIGEYDVRVFFNNTYKMEAHHSFSVKGATTKVTEVKTSKDNYSTTEKIEANFKNMSGSNSDWIAIYPKGSSNAWSNVIQWKWITGNKNGKQIFNPLSRGEYDIRVFFNNTYKMEAHHSFSVNDGITKVTEVKTSKDNYSTTEKIEANFKNMSGSSQDWIAIYPQGSSNDWSNVIQWRWITGNKNGTHTFNPLSAGKYEVRVFFNNTYKTEDSYKFTVSNTSVVFDRKDIQLFGDPELSRIVGMQMSTMKQVADFPLDGKVIYSSDIINDEKSYAYGRASNKIFVLKRDAQGNFSEQGIISLPFAPRTGAKNRKYGLTLITGSEKPMYALINTKNDTLVATGGRDVFTKNDDSNHGSKWATGHGNWLTDRMFIVPDRAARTLTLYKINPKTFKVKKLNSVTTSSSVHVVIGKLNNAKGIYYAVAEGSDESRPALIELKLKNNRLIIKRTVEMVGTNLKEMTAHHAKPLPDGVHIYMGTSDGTVNIIDKNQMRVIKTIKAGKGAGHTTLVPKLNLALVTNHHDQFVTVINTLTHTKIKDVHVSGPSIKNTALQSHTARVSADSKYYYNFATDNGYYFRINLETLKMDKTTYTGGTPKQASQPGEVN